MCDLLWSDPDEQVILTYLYISTDLHISTYLHIPIHLTIIYVFFSLACSYSTVRNYQQDGWNVSPRGAGYHFGGDVVAQFNKTNSISLMARAHQVVQLTVKSLIQKIIVLHLCIT